MRSLRFGFQSVCIAAFLFIAVMSSHGAWEPVEFPFSSARTRALAIAPSEPTRLYLGLEKLGVYRSDDRGLTWNSVSPGLPPGSTVGALVASPFDADHAWAGVDGVPPEFGVVWRTTNGGGSWTAGTGIDQRYFQDLLVNPTDSSLLLASTFTGITNRIQRSTDSGATWSIAGAGLGDLAYEFTVHPSAPNLILAATENGAARSTDGGLSWTPGTDDFYRNVVFAPSNVTRVYAATIEGDLYRSTNSGISFFLFGSTSPTLSTDYTQDELAVHPTNLNHLVSAGHGYAFQCSPPHPGEDDSLVITRSISGSAFVLVRAQCCPSDKATELAYDPQSPNYVYMGAISSTGGGVFYSEAGGVGGSWVTRTSGISNFAVAAVAGDLLGNNYARTVGGFCRSLGDGSPWTLLQSTDTYSASSRIEVNKSSPSILWESTNISMCYQDPKVFARRSTDFGTTWLPPGPGLSGLIWNVFTNHGDGTAVYVTTTTTGGLFRSMNGGNSFVQVSPDLQLPTRIVIDPTNGLRIFMARFANPQVVLSEDGGVTLEPRDAGLPPPFSSVIVEIFMRRADPNYLTIVYDNGDVWESFDGGIEWSRRFALSLPSAPVQCTWDDATGHVFLATSNGVVSSHPSYDPTGLPMNSVLAVHWDASRSLLFAGLTAGGMWKQSIAAPVAAPVAASTRRLEVHVSPNPTMERTEVVFEVPTGGAHVLASVYDANGRSVRRLVDAPLPGGRRRLIWDGTNENGERLGSGIYFLMARVGRSESRSKITLLR